MPTNGLVVITPTSIASTGTGNSSSINADGSIDFTSCATVSLNGIFSSTYSNYMVVIRGVWNTAGATNLELRLRASGTDNATTNSYVRQRISANGTTIAGDRPSGTFTRLGDFNSTRSGITLYLFGPYLTQSTAGRSVTVSTDGGAAIYDYGWTHSVWSAYDGFTIYPGSSSITGLLTVFGFNE